MSAPEPLAEEGEGASAAPPSVEKVADAVKSPVAGAAASVPGPLARLRGDVAALAASPARPRDTLIVLAALSVIVIAGGLSLANLTKPVARIEGVERPVSALRWVDDGLLELGTAGAGVATWQVSAGAAEADTDPDRRDRTVLSLPPMPPDGSDFAQRPAVTLWVSAPEAPPDMSALMQRMIANEGRLPLLEFRQTTDDPADPPRFIPHHVALGTDAVLGEDLPGVTATSVSPDRSIAFTGDALGAVEAQDLSGVPSATVGPATLDLYDFGLPGETGEGPVQPAAVVALAAAGTGNGERVAAAAADGRIVVLRAVDPAAQSPEVLPLRNVLATDAGLPPPELWVEPVGAEVLDQQGVGGGLDPIGFSRDRSVLTFRDTAQARLIQVEVGGTAQAVLPYDAGNTGAVIEPAALADMLTDLPLLQGDLLNLLFAEWRTAAAGGSVSPQDAAFQQTLRQTLPWKLPLDLLLGTATSPVTGPATRASIGQPGSARDPDTGRIALFGSRGQIIVLTPGVEDQGDDLGDGRLVADAAFEPGTGALVVLYADGTARRWQPGTGAATDLVFAPPDSTDGAPPPEARALAFPPGEMVTLVHWSRTATAPAILRRYDRATAAPLGPGLDVGFEDFILPDRANLMISVLNGQEILLRDARTGVTVLNAVFEGGLVRLAPSNDGRDLGVVIRGDTIWTLRLDPPGGGAPPPLPDGLAYAPLGDPVALSLPVAVARDGLSFSADGGTLLARTRDGQLYASRRGDIADDGPGPGCCIFLRRILPGVVALRAVLRPDGSHALVAGADHRLWRVSLIEDEAAPLVQLAGPVRDMVLSPDGRRLALAAEDAGPMVVDLGPAAWLAALPGIGHAPYAVPLPLAARDMPPAAAPPDGAGDTIVLGTFARLSDAVALRDAVQGVWSEVRILQGAPFYAVTVTLDAEATRDLRTLRQALSRARASAPAARGASLAAFAALCPVPDAAGAVPPVDLRCRPAEAAPPATPALQSAP